MARGTSARQAIGAAAALLLALATVAAPAAAGEEDAALKVPRFVSLHSDKVNLRSGPGRQYPIDWVLIRKDLPVEIFAQFEHWRHIRAWDGTEGWVQQHMVAGKRYVVVVKGGAKGSAKGGDPPLRRQPDPSAAIVARAEPGVIARLVECRGGWCQVEAGGMTAWMQRGDLWGVYPDENVP